MIIQLLDGTSLDIADYNLKRLFHRIPSPTIDHNFVSVDGSSDIITNSKMNSRVISVEFLYSPSDIYDFYYLRDMMNELFFRTEEFYIIFKREPYKRYKVKLNQQFQLEPTPNMGTFTVDFINTSGYSESTYKSIDLVKEWDADVLHWGGNFDWDAELPKYQFNTTSFSVYNLGNIKVDPRQHDLEIEVAGSFGSFMTIQNNTTNEVYVYNRPIPTGTEFKISNIRTLRNGTSDFANTNKKLITLAPGKNDIVITGGIVNSVIFDFRFLYK